MGTTTPAETLDSCKEVPCDLEFFHNMIQILMDGPNVNWKMLEIAKEHRKQQDSDALSSLEEVVVFMFFMVSIKQHNLLHHGS